MMELVLLTENYPPNRGGMAQSCDRLVHELRKNGIKIHVIHFTNRRKSFSTQQKEKGSYTAVPKTLDMAHGLNLVLTFLENATIFSGAKGLFIFGGFLPVSAGPIFSKLLGLSLFTCIRGNDFDISIFDSKRRAGLKLCLEESKAVFAVSKTKVDKIKKIFDCKNVVYTPNGINSDEWKPLKSEFQFAATLKETYGDKKIIGIFGQLKVKKGVLFFLNSVVRSGCADRFTLLLSGELGEEVETFIAEHFLSVHCIPFLDRVELIKYYLACNWIAIPSYYEGMPNVMLEAGALGIPVIASNVDGMRDVMAQEFSEYLFTSDHFESSCRVLRKISHMNDQAYKLVSEKFAEHIRNDYTAAKEIIPYLNEFRDEAT